MLLPLPFADPYSKSRMAVKVCGRGPRMQSEGSWRHDVAHRPFLPISLAGSPSATLSVAIQHPEALSTHQPGSW